jgi:peptidoglycan/xylan/chitin deacetylase (PgdA/CDA1 family)
LRIPGLKSLRLSARWLRSRLVCGALILGYHRVTQTARDSYSLCVTPQHFLEHLEVLSQVGEVISLQELVRGLREGHVPRRAVVLTFDDGYADVLYHAKPLLERCETPATVFVTTGSLGREFWWDHLERMLLSSTTLPEQLDLRIRDGSYEWVADHLRKRPIPSTRQHIMESIFQSLLPLSPAERETAMVQLRVWSEIVADDQPSRRALTADELIELAAGGLVDVGAHTVTHPLLADLPYAAQRAEIRESKVHLENILGRSVTSFSYPNGSSSPGTRAIVRESGFCCACASYSDVVWAGSDCFHLPRFWMSDWNGRTLLRWLRLWL